MSFSDTVSILPIGTPIPPHNRVVLMTEEAGSHFGLLSLDLTSLQACIYPSIIPLPFPWCKRPLCGETMNSPFRFTMRSTKIQWPVFSQRWGWKPSRLKTKMHSQPPKGSHPWYQSLFSPDSEINHPPLVPTPCPIPIAFTLTQERKQKSTVFQGLQTKTPYRKPNS